MQLEVWNIEGKRFHFGQRGLGLEDSAITFPSDSLFAALTACLAYRQNTAELSTWVQAFRRELPALVLSSTLPYAGGVRFFPRPLYRTAAKTQSTAASGKEQKRIRYVSESVFRRLLGGETLASMVAEDCLLQGGQVLVSAEDRANLPKSARQKDFQMWVTSQRARVTIGRDTANSELFHSGQVNFAPDCGLWFGVWWLDKIPQLKLLLSDALQDLGDSGLGGERSVGLGQANIRMTGQLQLPDAQDLWVSLSRYLPRPDEMDTLAVEGTAYALQTVGGWLNSPTAKSERRRPLHMLAEGSCFGSLPRRVPGQVVDVQPVYGNNNQPVGHEVWRCGLALPVGFESQSGGGAA